MIAIMDAIIMASIIIYGLIMILDLRAIAMIAIIIAILVLVVGLDHSESKCALVL